MLTFIIAATLVLLGPRIVEHVRVVWRVRREMRSPETQRRIDRKVAWRAAQLETHQRIEREVDRLLKEDNQ